MLASLAAALRAALRCALVEPIAEAAAAAVGASGTGASVSKGRGASTRFCPLGADDCAVWEGGVPSWRELAARAEATAQALAFAALGLAVCMAYWAALRRVLQPEALHRATDRVHAALSPLHLATSYGLFARVTKARFELVIEASEDGEHWRELPARYKPVDAAARPKLVPPGHMPRLDWRLWFAALASTTPPWVDRLLERLRQGEPAVARLLGVRERERRRLAQAHRSLRVRRYEYGFAPPGTGAGWWRRSAEAGSSSG